MSEKIFFWVTFVTYCARAAHAIDSQHFDRPFDQVPSHDRYTKT
jgi:hypothetical protein